MKKLLVTFFIIAILIGAMPKLAEAQLSPNEVTGGAFKAQGGETATKQLLAPIVNPVVNGVQTVANAASNIMSAVDCTANPVNCAQLVFVSIIQWLGNIILSTVSWILWFAGIIFNFSIIVLVIHMKDVLNSIPAVFTVWQVLRDFANMFFIFILLYIAIGTILGTLDWRKPLRNIILVALFLNFSFFITGVLIDASNIVALQFYNGFAGSGCSNTAALGVAETADGCMSYKIVSALKLQTIYDTGEKNGTTNGTNSAASLWIATNNSGNASMAKFLISIICGSILMIVVAGIFIASAILIFYRFIELLVILMISPLAFVSMVIPGQASTIWKRWSEKLVHNLIFAPAYFMFLWICMMVISQGNLQTVLGATSGFQDAFSKGTDAQGVFGLLANYIIIIMLLGYSLKLAAELSATGVKQATAAAKGFQGWVGRQTVGRAAKWVDKKWEGTTARVGGKKFGFDVGGNSYLGSRLRDVTTKPLAGGKYGGSKTLKDDSAYEDARKEKVRVAARRQTVDDAILTGSLDKVARAVRDLDLDIVNLPSGTLTNKMVVTSMTQAQNRAIERIPEDKISAKTKAQIRDVRTEPLRIALRAVPPVPPGATPTPAAVASVGTPLNFLHPIDIAKLPMADLENPLIYQNLNVQSLIEIGKTTTAAERATLSPALRAYSTLAAAAPGASRRVLAVEKWLTLNDEGSSF